MLIGIIGDTHGDVTGIKKAVAKAAKVDMWLHTGDFLLDASELVKESNLPVIAVAGNNDVAREEDLNKVITLEGHKLWLTHAHKYLSGYGNALLYRAQELGANIVVYGHTHVPKMEWYEDILFINPGSSSFPRGGSKRGFMVLQLVQESKPIVEYINL